MSVLGLLVALLCSASDPVPGAPDPVPEVPVAPPASTAEQAHSPLDASDRSEMATQAPRTMGGELLDPFSRPKPRNVNFRHPDLRDPFGPQKLPTLRERGDHLEVADVETSSEAPAVHPADRAAPSPSVTAPFPGLIDPFASTR